MNKFVFLLIAFTFDAFLPAPQYFIKSPDQQLSISVNINKNISFAVEYKNSLLLNANRITMEINGDEVLGLAPILINRSEESIKEQIYAPLSTKSSVINNEFNLLTLTFKDNYKLEFRAYNHGVAYRFVTSIPNDIIVFSETVDLNFDKGSSVYFPEEESIISHYERSYKYSRIGDIDVGKFCSLPFLIESPDGLKILFSESDLDDYPGLFMKKTGATTFSALFPKYVLNTTPFPGREDRNEVIEKEADYIARTVGDRSFPWRVFIIGEDKDLIESSLMYQLASPSKIENTDWIKPGQIAWDWYNANNIYGVDFESGLNTDTYKYYIDFASDNGIKYIILDEGWSKSTTNITAPADNLDVKELIRYGKEKGVGVILWVLWKPLDQDLSGILTKYKNWGAVGVKVDFMQRSDQYMVNFYKRVAIEAAKNELVVDFHGAYKPTGLNREYPNVLTFEGVKGNEHNKWSHDITPDHNLTIPFIRMAAGPMDYTPGAMANAQMVNHFISFERPIGQGTRCHEVSKYIIFESPLQMLCDSPSRYKKEIETVQIIVQIPQVWDETKVLEAKISDYLLLARRSGDNWYIAAMTDWTAREFDVKLDFLPPGEYDVQIMEDGPNANRFAEDYRLIKTSVKNNEVMKAVLEKGGGWVAILKKQ